RMCGSFPTKRIAELNYGKGILSALPAQHNQNIRISRGPTSRSRSRWPIRYNAVANGTTMSDQRKPNDASKVRLDPALEAMVRSETRLGGAAAIDMLKLIVARGYQVLPPAAASRDGGP